MALTVAQAAEQWEEAKRASAAVEARLDEAAVVLKEYFRRTKRTAYKGRIGYACSTYRSLDTAKVRAELADRIDQFETPRTRETLSLLKPATKAA